MRNATRLFVLVGALAVSTVAIAKGRPQPIPCPPDVAAALAAQCPCAGTTQPDQSVTPWRNHGQYVRCVVHFRNLLRKSGCLTADDRPTLGRCAARSTCGKDTVLCCTYALGTCNDPMPPSLQAMAPDMCRPFSIDRKGMVLGEGAATLVLEEKEHALRRGAHIYAEVAGAGSTSDAGHLTQPNADRAAAAIRAAHKDAEIGEDTPDVNARVSDNAEIRVAKHLQSRTEDQRNRVRLQRR